MGRRGDPLMSVYTVIVADHSSATIYDLAGRAAPLTVLDRLVNPAGHRHERALGRSAPGRVMGWNGLRHAFSRRHARLEHATENFVRAVIVAADRPAPGQQRYEVLLVTTPELHGIFRRLAPRSWHVTVLPCNLANAPSAELHSRIAGFLNAPPARPRRGWFGAA